MFSGYPCLSLQVMFLWVGKNCGQNFISRVLGVQHYASIPHNMVRMCRQLPTRKTVHKGAQCRKGAGAEQGQNGLLHIPEWNPHVSEDSSVIQKNFWLLRTT